MWDWVEEIVSGGTASDGKRGRTRDYLEAPGKDFNNLGECDCLRRIREIKEKRPTLYNEMDEQRRRANGQISYGGCFLYSPWFRFVVFAKCPIPRIRKRYTRERKALQTLNQYPHHQKIKKKKKKKRPTSGTAFIEIGSTLSSGSHCLFVTG